MAVVANAGVPMLWVVGPVFLLGLLPIILLEIAVYWWRLRERSSALFLVVPLANIVSTIVGIPLTWLALVGLQIFFDGTGSMGPVASVTLQAPWLLPHEDRLHWMIPTAALVLNIPFFFMSVGVEFATMGWAWERHQRRAVLRVCWLANGISYGVLTAFWLLWLLSSIGTNTSK